MAISQLQSTNAAIVLGQSKRSQSIIQLLELVFPYCVYGESDNQWPDACECLSQFIPCLSSQPPVIALPYLHVSILFMPFDYLPRFANLDMSNCEKINYVAVYDVPNDTEALLLLRQGMHGVFYQDEPLENFVRGGKSILNGDLWYKRCLLSRHILSADEPPKNMDIFAHRPAVIGFISKREMEVLSLLSKGAKNEQIGNTLFISTHTVKTHVSHLFKKLQLTTRSEVAGWAAKHERFLQHHYLNDMDS